MSIRKTVCSLVKQIKNSISFKISLLNSAFFCLAFLIILIIVYKINYRIVESKEEQMLDSYIFNSLVSIDDKLFDMGRVSKMTMSDDKTQEIIKSFSSKSFKEQQQDMEYLDNYYTSLISIRDDITGLYLCDNESLIFYRDSANPSRRRSQQYSDVPAQIRELATESMIIANCKLVNDVQPRFMKYSEVYTSDPYYNNCIWLIRDIYSFSPHLKIGSIAIISPVRVMKEILEERLGEDMFYILITQSGEIVCCQDSELLGKNLQDINADIYLKLSKNGKFISVWNDEKCKLEYQTSKNSRLILIAGSPVKYISQKAGGFFKYYLILCICVIVFIVTSTFFITGKMLLPIKKLANGMINFNTESMKKRYPVTSADETGQLIEAFNKMMDMLEELIKTQFEDKMKIKEIQMKEQQLSMLYLKNQVNPHFLYNTLDNIRIRAEINKDTDVAYMLKYLVDFFRLNVSTDKQLVTLEHEIELIMVYLKLMCYRYPDIKCEYDIDDELLDIQVPNFILQPIVENSLLHGLCNKAYKGTIKVSVHRRDPDSDFVEINISDNGVGFSEETRCRVEKMLGEMADVDGKFGTENKRIGIINVQRRLKMYYSQECGLSYTDNPEGGVTAHILLKTKIQNNILQ